MSVYQRVVYERVTYKCDNCGVEENIVVLVDESHDSKHQLPPVKGWIAVPIRDFMRGEQHACSRRCADALSGRALDDIEAWNQKRVPV